MRLDSGWIIVAIVLTFGCDTKDNQPGGDPALAESTTADTADSGACPEIEHREGAWYCEQDSDCVGVTPTHEYLTAPRCPPSPYNANVCLTDLERCGELLPPTCRCFDDVLGRGGELIDGDGDGCFQSDLLGTCQYTVEEFPGCDPANATSCDAVCDAIHSLEVAAAAAIHTVENRGVRCVYGTCEGVNVIDGLCMVDVEIAAHAHDCGLSDAEIFAEHDALHTEPVDPCAGNSTGDASSTSEG